MSPPNPADISQYLAAPSEAEQELLRIHPPTAPLVVFDIGSCEGEDSVRYARRFPRSRIFAFEPLPANQELIRVNFATHAVTNAELVPLALSDRTGEASFYVSSGRPRDEFAGKDWNYGNKSSSLLAPAAPGPMHGWIEFKETIKVRTETLDNFCRQRGLGHIDFIHMDVQGAEQLVLNGTPAMLPHISAIWLEVSARENYRGQALEADISRFMQRHGFSLGFTTARGDGSGENDHLYLNRRHPRTWKLLAQRRLTSILQRVRMVAGPIRHSLRG